MLWILSILAFLVIFSLLVLVHEFGHFFVAKKCGIKVEEFGLGMPPQVWKFKPKNSETVYSLNAIPFGGFVRLFGEDSHDQKILANNRSFASKPVWQRLLVIVAGVVMNFVLAFVLLTIGLTIGMQPLIGDADGMFRAIDDGTIKLADGLVVKETGENNIGFQEGDRIISVNGKKIVLGDEIENLKNQENAVFQLERNGAALILKGVNDVKKPFFKLYDPLVLSQVVVGEVGKSNPWNLTEGAVIESVAGKRVFDLEGLQKALVAGKPDSLEVKLKKGDWSQLGVNKNELIDKKIDSFPVLISTVLPGSNAEKAGLHEGDRIVKINNVSISSVKDLPGALKVEEVKGQAVYTVNRYGTETDFFVDKGEGGMIGVLLAEMHYIEKYDASFYLKSIPYSVIKVNDVSYPWWQAPGYALKEMGNLSILTAQMFVNVFATIFTKFTVPEGVSGPVGIAQMTFVFVQEGIMSLMRFTALLSLSLGIINILPFPGLDGGRFFLIVIPWVFRRKINPKLEAYIHLAGFLVLMLLILMVTFSDLARIFGQMFR